jgi:hypothetical protein
LVFGYESGSTGPDLRLRRPATPAPARSRPPRAPAGRRAESIAALAVSYLILEGTAMPTSTVTRTPSRPQGKPQPSEDEREQARRALQTSMDTRQ